MYSISLSWIKIWVYSVILISFFLKYLLSFFYTVLQNKINLWNIIKTAILLLLG